MILKKNIKGQGVWPETLTYVIIAVTILLVISIVGMFFFNDTDTFIEEQKCKQFIRANAEARIKILGSDLTDHYGNIIQIPCATNYITIESDDETIMKDALGDAMASCWDYYGVDEDGKNPELFDTKDKNFCVVCARVEYEKPKQLTGFSNHLNTMEWKDGESVYHFLYGTDLPKEFHYEELSEEQKNIDTINTENPLAVIFYMTKDAHLGKTYSTAIGVTVGAVGVTVGVILTATGVLSWVGLPLTAASLGVTSVAIAGAGAIAAGGAAGYMAGSDHSSDFDSTVLLYSYDNIGDLDCDYLEGRSHGMEIKE
ncbi:MAG: hypothetical protein ABII01_06485 [Candidatus Woesearchaeota archaeon]